MTFITVLPTGGPLVRRQRPAIDRPATASPGFGMLQSEQTLESRALNKHSNYGFTLVELMVTLAVLAIIIGIAIPSMTTFVKNQAVRSTADELLMSIVYARSEAVKNNAVVSIVPKVDTVTGWSNGWCVVTGDSGGCGNTATLLREVQGRDGITVHGGAFKQSGALTRLRFNGKGVRVGGAGGQVVMKVSDNGDAVSPRCVGVAKNGRAISVSCN